MKWIFKRKYQENEMERINEWIYEVINWYFEKNKRIEKRNGNNKRMNVWKN